MTIPEILVSQIAPDISDIFLSAGSPPFVRRMGELFPLDSPPLGGDEIAAFRASALPAEKQEYYRETGSADAAVEFDDGHRFRLNFHSALTGDALAARPVLPADGLDLAELGLPEQLRELASEERGLLLVCGSTGSGKSTTLAAMINYINRTFRKHILSIEDPIEFIHRNHNSLVTQREVGEHTSGFAGAIRDAMRENPDVIVVGEMRDVETMQAAVNAALTGHLVISTVHTADTIQSVERIINLFPEEQRGQLAVDLSSALLGVAAQRLIPRRDRSRMIVAVEMLLGTPTVRKLISDRNFSDLELALKEGSSGGMENFTRAVFRLFAEKKISHEDALAAAGNREEFQLLYKGMENGVDAFRRHYGEKSDPGEELIDMGTLFYTAVRMGSSDLILTVDTPPSIRINGVIRALDLPVLTPEDMQKLLFGVITPHQRIVFEESRELDFAISAALKGSRDGDTLNCRFRVNAFHQRGNIGIVARVINRDIPAPESLGLPPVLVDMVSRQQGLILVTGPTGSGKSTTLASLIDRINRTRSAHVITIEDPIEYVHQNINAIIEQRELNSDPHDCATALKFTLRQDPDVILVGEMRDIATMAAAITAAETGHLVLATIHTNSAPQTIDRIVDSFPDHQQNQIKLQLAGVILGVISQRLLPRLDGKGRIAAFEVMVGTPPVQALIREGKTHLLKSTIETGYKDGMVTLDKALSNLYDRRLVAYEEVRSLQSDLRQVKSF